MLKKIIFSLCVFVLGQMAFAESVSVQIKPAVKTATSSAKLQEGDNIDFAIINDVYLGSKVYLKSGDTVSGTITSLKSNNFLYEPASIYVENFVTKDINGKKVKLDGIIYKKGSDYWMITQFIPIPFFALKGGNVKLNPKKDVFTLYLESKND